LSGENSTTQSSLLVRIRDPQDAEAWNQFHHVYGPLIFRFACWHGLQDSDAADLTQDVLREVCRQIGTFEYDREKGRFRGWLLTVARCTVSRIREARFRHPQGTGDTGHIRRLENVPNQAGDLDEYWNHEYEQMLFEWAANEVQTQVQPATWEAFRRTAVDGDKPADVASELGMNLGSVYVARNRVLASIKRKISEIDDE
jgi:RNA polymerase sigma factor (sigma-70 family)